jgi:hypothetical protein
MCCYQTFTLCYYFTTSYNIYHIHIFPSKVNGKVPKFTSVHPQKEIIMVDKTPFLTAEGYNTVN